MGKFKFDYTETYTHTYIVEAESLEEAQKKMENAAENISRLITDRDFDHWDVSAGTEASADNLENFDQLPEE